MDEEAPTIQVYGDVKGCLASKNVHKGLLTDNEVTTRRVLTLILALELILKLGQYVSIAGIQMVIILLRNHVFNA